MILHKNAQKRPVGRGYAKVPVIMQMEALECGAASLAMILAYYGKWIPLEQVRADCGVSRDGSNAKNLLLGARSYGLTAKGFRFEPDALRRGGIFPCIIHWNFNHFVVLNGFKGNKACLNDPARGNYTVSMETFDQSFTGGIYSRRQTQKCCGICEKADGRSRGGGGLCDPCNRHQFPSWNCGFGFPKDFYGQAADGEES